MALMISASTAIVGLWMRVALSARAAGRVARFAAAAVFTAQCRAQSRRSHPHREPQPTPERPSEPAAAPRRLRRRRATRSSAATPRRLARAPPAASGASDESAILSVLDRYRLAFSSLNPGSVRAVAFDNCRIDVQGVQAEAICAGRVSLVTRAGSQARNIQSRRWTFTLAHRRTPGDQTVDSQ